MPGEGTTPSSPVRAFIALGANLGDRLGNLRRALSMLGGQDRIRVVRTSRVFETDPIGPPQPDYLNAVVEVETTRSPTELLAACLDIEQEMGRVRTGRWGPRVIDLDLILYGDETIDLPGLQVPHPRMHERAFVLVPLLELEQDPMLPGGRRVAGLRLGGELSSSVRLFAPSM